jgi:hypothetical protein
MTPTTRELIFCRIEKLQTEKKAIQTSIERIIERQDTDSMEFVEMWQIDIESMDLQMAFLKQQLFHS